MAISLLRLPEVEARTGRSRPTIYADIRKGVFPRPVSIGPRAVAWRSDEIDDWIQKKIDETRQGG